MSAVGGESMAAGALLLVSRGLVVVTLAGFAAALLWALRSSHK